MPSPFPASFSAYLRHSILSAGLTFCFSPRLALDMNESSSGSFSLSQTAGTGKPLTDSVSLADFLHAHNSYLSSQQYSFPSQLCRILHRRCRSETDLVIAQSSFSSTTGVHQQCQKQPQTPQHGVTPAFQSRSPVTVLTRLGPRTACTATSPTLDRRIAEPLHAVVGTTWTARRGGPLSCYHR